MNTKVQAEPGLLSRGTLICLATGMLVHMILGLWAIRAQSPTFDEPLHLAAGLGYWKARDYRINGHHHPPLSSLVGAFPLLLQGAALPNDDPLWLRPRWNDATHQYSFANRVLYHNPVVRSADRIMGAGRTAMLVVSCFFLVALYFAVFHLAGPIAAWISFALASLCPVLLAHSTLVTTDFLFSAFYFLFFFCFGQWQAGEQKAARPAPDDRMGWAVAAGLCFGLSFCSKFSAVAIGPVLLLWCFGRRFQVRWRFPEIGAFLGSAFLMVLLAYQVSGLPEFVSGLANLKRVQSGRSTFLLGDHSTEGWWYYFPLAFLWKTPLAELLGAAGVISALARKQLKASWYLVLPPVIYFGIACTSSVQIGHRHILPVYPFLYALIGIWLARNWGSFVIRGLTAILGVLLLTETLFAGPIFLSHFNLLLPGRDKPYFAFSDSNIDWGQGMLALKKFIQDENVGGIYLSYFGTAEPHAYGIPHVSVAPITIPAFAEDELDMRKEKRALFVISATNLANTYFADRNLFSWLHDKKPLKVLAKSLVVYDITTDAESHRRLAVIFQEMGKAKMAQAERKWAEDLSRTP